MRGKLIEYFVADKLEGLDWIVFPISGSGQKAPFGDLIAIRRDRVHPIEVKSTRKNVYYVDKHFKGQLERGKEIREKTSFFPLVVVVYRKGRGKPREIRVFYDFGKNKYEVGGGMDFEEAFE